MSKLIDDIKKTFYSSFLYNIFNNKIHIRSIVHHDTITDASKPQHTFLSIVIP